MILGEESCQLMQLKKQTYNFIAKPTLKEAGQGKENLLNDLLSEILSIKLSKNYQVAHTKILISIENL